MPASTQQRPRGFAPLFRPGYSDQHLRVSDAERTEVAGLLGEHYSDGRLDRAEFDERVAQAMSAKTRADLAGLFDDLPDLGHGTASAPEQGAARRAGPARRHGRLFPLLVLIIAVIAVNSAAHAFFAWLWLCFLAAIVVVAVSVLARVRR